MFHGGTPSFALVDGTCYNLAGLAANVRTVTTTATAAVTDFLIQGDATAGFFVLTLPAAPPTGKIYFLKKIDSTSNGVDVTPAAGTMHRRPRLDINMGTQYDWMIVQWNGSRLGIT